MKRCLLCVCLWVCISAFAAAPLVSQTNSIGAQKGKKLELCVSMLMPHGEFLHIMHNPLKDTINIMTFNACYQLIKNTVAYSLRADERPSSGSINDEPAIFKKLELASLKSGIIAVAIQSLKQKQDRVLFLRHMYVSGVTFNRALEIKGQVKDVRLRETPDQELEVKLRLKNGEKFAKGYMLLSRSLDLLLNFSTAKTYHEVDVV